VRRFAAAGICLAACLPSARAADAADNSAEIVVQALALLGVPYRWGGNDPRRGLDCSGLVRHVFKTVVALDLPRRSEQMSRLGQRVDRAELRAGDLVFFNTLGYPNSHVAVYVGEGRFVHAPGRNSQVRVDGLEDRYWRQRFNGARRLDIGFAEPAPVVESRDGPPRLRPEDYPNGP
jgi:cell wall-associated NlpC family hydrolase